MNKNKIAFHITGMKQVGNYQFERKSKILEVDADEPISVLKKKLEDVRWTEEIRLYEIDIVEEDNS